MKQNSLKMTLAGIAAFALYLIWPTTAPVGNDTAETEPEVIFLDDGKKVPFAAKTVTIPQPTVWYLQNSLLYGNYYNENQKFIVYFNDIAYPPAFLPALNNLSHKRPYNSEYTFLPRHKNATALSADELKADVAFVRLCRQFCVINPQRSEIFYIDGIGTEDAREIDNIFNGLENW